jgi:succinyl-CoA synthetase alpha subunit
MGHAGAIIAGAEGTAADKIRVLEENGIPVAKRPADIVGLVQEALA